MANIISCNVKGAEFLNGVFGLDHCSITIELEG